MGELLERFGIMYVVEVLAQSAITIWCSFAGLLLQCWYNTYWQKSAISMWK